MIPRLELLLALLLSKLFSSMTCTLEREMTSLTTSPTQWWHYFGSKEWKKVGSHSYKNHVLHLHQLHCLHFTSKKHLHTGVKFASPLYVRQSYGTLSKVWICLYTCCAVRAIYLDLVLDLTTAAFIRSLKQFALCRGFPAKMVLENGKTFKAAAETIESVVTSSEVQQNCTGVQSVCLQHLNAQDEQLRLKINSWLKHFVRT